MVMRKLQSPDLYPIAFHNALEEGLRILQQNNCPIHVIVPLPLLPYKKLLTEANRFQVFLWNIRKHPYHRLNTILRACRIRCEILDRGEESVMRLRFDKSKEYYAALVEAALAGR